MSDLEQDYRHLKAQLLNDWDNLSSLQKFKVACLPDFFFDIILTPQKGYESFLQDIEEVYNRGGGVYKSASLTLSPGGNAGNMAVVLGSLGLQPVFITKVSAFGKSIIEHFMKPFGIDLAITGTGVMPSTVALELERGDSYSNVMINTNLDTLSRFGPEQLEQFQWDLISQVDIVAITNFCANDCYIELVRAMKKRTSRIFLDFSDISGRRSQIEAIHQLFGEMSREISHVSVNENEIAFLSNQLPGQENPLKLAEILAEEHPNITFCLHTAGYSAEIRNGKSISKVPALPVKLKRVTGAGDTWNAGYLFALDHTEPEQRLLFANSCAAYRMATEEFPTVIKLKKFLNSIE
ncbi:MAG: carbohydrate kinase family protein [Candidatus Odinarchaeota archaeon]